MPSNPAKLDIREVFLQGFVRKLAMNSYTPEKAIPKREIKKIPPQAQFHKSMMRKPALSAFHPSPFQPSQRAPPVVQAQRPVLPARGVVHEPVNLGKLTNLLLDPSVLSVECPGPSKNVLVNRSGAIQATGLVLTKDEINAIINEISIKTRIPTVPGLFKVAFHDLVITAVISEFVGTRFLLKKITPFGTA